jgi:phage-related protein
MSKPSATATRPLTWLGSSKKDLLVLPDTVIDTFGYALHLAQIGKKHPKAKPLHGFGSAGVLEVVEDWHNNTYRAVYTVRFSATVYVLHVFQKKSKSGSVTFKLDMEMIRDRLNIAQQFAKG